MIEIEGTAKRFNPCFNGTYSLTQLFLDDLVVLIHVLILVLMELTL